MSRIGDMMSAALTVLRGDLGSPTFTFNDVAVPCVPNTLSEGSIVAVGGYEMAITLSLYVERTEFGNALTSDSTLISVDSEVYTVDSDGRRPVTGETLTYQSKTYRIASAKFDASQTYITLLCADPNR